ncbi:hypothetical protein BDAP_002160 [Binucleata daphniae]
MGNTPSNINSLLVLKIKQNSPAHIAGILPFINIITHINDLPANLDVLKNINTMWSKQNIKLTIKDVRTENCKTIEISQKREGQSLGMSVTLNDTNFNLCFCVLEVDNDTPAFHAGLIENQDYIIGIENINLKDEDDFFAHLYKNANKKVNLMVCNTGMLNLRIVELVPQKEVLLGCELGSGMLYKLPQKDLLFDFECSTTRFVEKKIKEKEVIRTNNNEKVENIVADIQNNAINVHESGSNAVVNGVDAYENDIQNVDKSVDNAAVNDTDLHKNDFKNVENEVVVGTTTKNDIVHSNVDVQHNNIANETVNIDSDKDKESLFTMDSYLVINNDEKQNDILAQNSANETKYDIKDTNAEQQKEKTDEERVNNNNEVKDDEKIEVEKDAQNNNKHENISKETKYIQPEIIDNIELKTSINDCKNISELCEKVSKCDIDDKKEISSESDENYKCYEINNNKTDEMIAQDAKTNEYINEQKSQIDNDATIQHIKDNEYNFEQQDHFDGDKQTNDTTTQHTKDNEDIYEQQDYIDNNIAPQEYNTIKDVSYETEYDNNCTSTINQELINILSQDDEECAFEELVNYSSEAPTITKETRTKKINKEISLSDELPENITENNNKNNLSPTHSDPGAFDVKKFDDLRNTML